MKLGKLYTPEEADKVNNDAVSRGFYRFDVRIFLPGTAWTMPWYFDPQAEDDCRFRRNTGFYLSEYYWNDWSFKRPPITVVCPNGEQWCIDAKSSNGNGWQVTGEWPSITCSPSIVVRGYHGWLRDGEFSQDVEGRLPYGIPRS